VKVYVRHHDATPEDLRLAASAAPGVDHVEMEEFARAMGGGARRFKDRATFTCAAFVGASQHPAAATQYVPVCAYALDDLEVQDRVSSYLREHGLDALPYRRVLDGFANRPLDAGVGMQSWVAFRRYQGVPRLTIYLGTETGRVHAPGSVPAGTRQHMSFENAAAVLACVDSYGLDDHPLLRALARHAADRRLLWLLAHNASELLSESTPWSAAQLRAWLDDHAAVERQLTDEQLVARHLFRDVLAAFASSPDPVEVAAAEAVAGRTARRLSKALLEFLEAEETSSAGFSLDDVLRDRPEAEAARVSELDAAGSVALPSVVRGALGLHERLWTALDELAELADHGEEAT
jgi:hypothetical protein